VRVAINVLGLSSFRQGGAGVYALSLIEGLAHSARAEVMVLCDRELRPELQHIEGLVEIRAVAREHRSTALKALELAGAVRDPRRYRDGYSVGAEALGGFDLVHYPLSFLAPPQHDLPIVLTCVDLQHRRFPRFFSLEDRLLRRVRWDRSLAVADEVIAISEFTRQAVLEHGRISRERVHVVYLACDERFFKAARPGPRERFFFYPASPLPAKNHGRLLDAFARVAERHPGLRLALSGPAMHDWGRVEKAIADRELQPLVEVEGTLSIDQLQDRYARALALIFPSLYEGFGLPLVEAMASGCLVAASRAGSIPEVLGDNGILFDPREASEIEAAMERVLELGDEERDRITEAARERARMFQPERLIQQTLGVYAQALAGRGSGVADERGGPGSPSRSAA
jgi:glycosyltransferase involved in cell wall biosynthesis